MFSTNFI